MRRYLVLFLMVWMPLQFSWAAVSGYCLHETGVAAQHLGHHEHEHQDQDQSVQAQKASAGSIQTALPVLGGDADCAACHAGSVPVLPHESVLVVRFHGYSRVPHLEASLTAPPVQRLERPQWCPSV